MRINEVLMYKEWAVHSRIDRIDLIKYLPREAKVVLCVMVGLSQVKALERIIFINTCNSNCAGLCYLTHMNIVLICLEKLPKKHIKSNSWTIRTWRKFEKINKKRFLSKRFVCFYLDIYLSTLGTLYYSNFLSSSPESFSKCQVNGYV